MNSAFNTTNAAGLVRPSVIFAGHDGGFADRRMRDQCALDFRGAQPEAVYFEKIVGAAGVPEVAFFILKILVAGAEPIADKSFLGFFVFVPVAGARGITFDKQIADFVGAAHIAYAHRRAVLRSRE